MVSKEAPRTFFPINVIQVVSWIFNNTVTNATEITSLCEEYKDSLAYNNVDCLKLMYARMKLETAITCWLRGATGVTTCWYKKQEH